MDERKQRVLLRPTTSLRSTMQAIDDSGLGIALIVDDDNRLAGTVSDGDLRRAILGGADLESAVVEIMNASPQTVGPRADMQEIRNVLLEAQLRPVPVIDEAGRVIDIRTSAELWSVPLSNPDVTELEIDAVLDVLKTPHLSLGPKVGEFEERVAEYADRRFAVAVSSGTCGLHLVVRGLGLGEGDEVITTSFSFIASANVILYERATPVFVDIDPATYNIDPDRIEAAITPRTKAILAVDVFGQPADYDALQDIAERHGISLISDCCESIGAEYRGAKASRHGVAGVFAFYPNKQITTGEGGIIVTDDERLAKLCRSMRNQGRSDEGGWLRHDRLGFNYRLSDISCALGIVQLERIDEILRSRQRVADLYTELLADVPELHTPHVAEQTTRMSWFVYVARLADTFSRKDRDQLLGHLQTAGIGANNYFPPIHLQPLYRRRFGFEAGMLPVTEHIAARTIALPFHNNVSATDCEKVVGYLRDALAELSVTHSK